MIRIRPMRAADIRPAIELWKRTPGTSTGDTPAEIRRFLRRNPGGSFVATDGRRLIAAVLGGHDGRRGTIWHLAVDPESRRRGLGRKLVRLVLKQLKLAGIRKVNILVMADNRSAMTFWKRQGWSRFAVANFSIRLDRR